MGGKPRSEGPLKDEILGLFIDKLLDAGVIEKSTAAHHSYAHLVPKEDLRHKTAEQLVSSYRLVVDSRSLNQATKPPTRWPLGIIPDIINRIGKTKPQLFSKVDLTKGFRQVELEAQSRPYTAFLTSKGVYQWTRLPMSLRGSPSYSQYLVRTQILNQLVP